DEGNRRGLRLRRPARQLSPEGKQGRIRRHGASRRDRRVQAQSDPGQRRRPLLLHGYRLLRSHQDRDEADDPRRGAGVRVLPWRLQRGERLVLAVLRREQREGKFTQAESHVREDRGQRADRRIAIRETVGNGTEEATRRCAMRSAPFAILLFASVALAQTPAIKVDSETISGLGARNIGSATMSGRVAALDAVQE